MIRYPRTLILLAIFFKASLRRIRYDLARELVVALCTLILILLFFYIFNDFINVKVSELSAELQSSLARWFSYALLVLVSLACGGILRRYRLDPAELAQAAARRGELPQVCSRYSLLRNMSVILIFFICTWYIITKFFISDLSLMHWAQVQLAMLVICGAVWLIPEAKKDRIPRSDRSMLMELITRSKSKRASLLFWRLGQLVLRNRAAQICLIAALCVLGLMTISAWLGLPFFVAALLSLASGLILASALSFQLESDMQHAWLEKSLGLSHADFTSTYFRLGLVLGISQGLLAVLVYSLAIGELPGAEPWKLLAMSALCPLLLSSLMFQIDARKPVISIITCFLVGLFLGTAILAHWLGIILVPIVTYYSSQYQSKQYYQY